jgi:hypothetical protein
MQWQCCRHGKVLTRTFRWQGAPSIVDDRTLSRSKLNASGIFLHFDNADFTPLPANVTNMGSKDHVILPQSGPGSLEFLAIRIS